MSGQVDAVNVYLSYPQPLQGGIMAVLNSTGHGHNWRDLSGKTFGETTVLSWEGRQGRNSLWKCRCEKCGRIFLRSGSTIKRSVRCGCRRNRPCVDLMKRVRKKVKIAKNGCWLWKRPCGGYARTSVNGKLVQVHRAVYEAVKGKIPEGLWLLHNCPGGDNPECCNPAHMFPGTAGDNNRDTLKKGRTAHGNMLPHAKLTPKSAVKVFGMYHVDGKLQVDIARHFGVSPEVISAVIRRETWRRATKDVAAELGFTDQIPYKRHNRIKEIPCV